jgi:sugar phosphate isomerase/epimerase
LRGGIYNLGEEHVLMLKLSAFADEIAPELPEQIRVCTENHVTHVELRSVDKINVLDFSAAKRGEVRSRLTDGGLGVIAIGSPIGKIKISDAWPGHFDRFKYAVDQADFFSAPYIRLFSYYPPTETEDVHRHRDEVMKRMRAKVEYVKDRPVTLLHENERGIFGDHGKYCLDLLETIDSPKLRNAFDFANFVQVGDKPLDNWPSLKPFTDHIHIKDAMMAGGKVVPPGQGDGQLEPILVDAYRSGYRGFLSMEPHLAAHEKFSGFSGPKLFKVAVDALKEICQRNGIPLAGVP